MYGSKKRETVEISPPLVGYVQHTSPLFPNTALILNVLIQMKNSNIPFLKILLRVPKFQKEL
jgi:hypothetical protein